MRWLMTVVNALSSLDVEYNLFPSYIFLGWMEETIYTRLCLALGFGLQIVFLQEASARSQAVNDQVHGEVDVPTSTDRAMDCTH